MGVLFLLMLVGLSLAGTGEAWSLASRRARERQLLWVGNQYARAIRAYYDQTPGGAKQYPAKFEDLLEDNRFAQPRHHLRQLYPDPVSRQDFAIVLSPDGRIGGVHSRSDDEPMKQANFPTRFDSFKGSTHYSDWNFNAADPANAALAQQAQRANAGNAAAAAANAAGATSPANATTPVAAPGSVGQQPGPRVGR
jgi:type II secretory pathway pseudopilin PulG